MKKTTADAALSDLLGLFDPGSARKPSAIEAAMYLEDCLGLVLTDDEIASGELDGPDGIRGLVARKAAS